MIKDLLTSKKAITAIASVFAGLVARIGFEIPAEDLVPILSPAMAYIVGQGIADHGKERAKIERENGQ